MHIYNHSLAGHNRPIATMCMCGDKLLSGSFEDATNSTLGVVRAWDIATGLSTPFSGPDGTQKARSRPVTPTTLRFRRATSCIA